MEPPPNGPDTAAIAVTTPTQYPGSWPALARRSGACCWVVPWSVTRTAACAGLRAVMWTRKRPPGFPLAVWVIARAASPDAACTASPAPG
jgi:hypothetical protein